LTKKKKKKKTKKKKKYSATMPGQCVVPPTMAEIELRMLGSGRNMSVPGCEPQPRFANFGGDGSSIDEIKIDVAVCPGRSVILSRIDVQTQRARWETRVVNDRGRVSVHGMPEEVFVVRCPSAGDAVNIVARYVNINHKKKGGSSIREKKGSSRGKKNPPHILMLSLDAVSRAQYLRVMPRLRDAINDALGQDLSDVVVANMTQYSARGLNTHPNFAAILAGMSETEFRKRCGVTLRSEFDPRGTPAPLRSDGHNPHPDCVPTLLERLRNEAGYRTMLMENVPSYLGGSLCELLCSGCSASVACYVPIARGLHRSVVCQCGAA
jgi:hypothetical protein